MNDIETAWLAGLLEGEGSFIKGATPGKSVIQVAMTDVDIIERVASLWNRKIWSYSVPGRKTLYMTAIGGNSSIPYLTAILPYMGNRRSVKIVELLDFFESWKDPRKKLTDVEVTDIQRLIKKGCSQKELAQRYNVNRETIYRRTKELVSYDFGTTDSRP